MTNIAVPVVLGIGISKAIRLQAGKAQHRVPSH
jgi:hypothetical protein